MGSLVYSEDLTQDWTVGLDSEKIALIILGDWNDTGIRLPTYRGCEFLVATPSCHFSVSLRMIALCNSFPMLTSEESSYGIHWLLLADSRTQGACGTTRFEKAAASWAISMVLPILTRAMLLFCKLYNFGFSSPDYPLSVWKRH